MCFLQISVARSPESLHTETEIILSGFLNDADFKSLCIDVITLSQMVVAFVLDPLGIDVCVSYPYQVAAV